MHKTGARALLAALLAAAAASAVLATPHPMREAAAFPRAVLFRGEVLHTDREAPLDLLPGLHKQRDAVGLFLVHVRAGLSEAELRAVGEAAGAPLHDYLPHHTWTVRSTAGRVAALREHPALNGAVLWTGRFPEKHKISPALGAHAAAARAHAAKRGAPAQGLELVVDLARGPGPLDAARREWTAARPAIESFQALAPPRALVRLAAGLDEAAVAAEARWLASRHEVVHVTARPVRVALNNYARHLLLDDVEVTTGTSTVDNTFSAVGVDGSGVVVGCADTGITMGSCYFEDTSVDAPFDKTDASHRKVIHYDAFVDEEDGEAHGTHVAGSIAGAVNGASPGTDAGIAPGAKLWFTDIGNSDGLRVPADPERLFGLAYDDGARVHSNSWGSAAPPQYLSRAANFYGSDERAYDDFVYHHDDMLLMFAAGNDGGAARTHTVGAPSTGKNVLSVGASSNTAAAWDDYSDDAPPGAASYNDAGSVASFSGNGPTNDGRIKPDVVAPGHQIKSALNADGCGTRLLSGTSMACPVTAGATALLINYLRDGHSPDFDAAKHPSAALLRAMLVNGAAPMARRQYAAAQDVGRVMPLASDPEVDLSNPGTSSGHEVVPTGRPVFKRLPAGGACHTFAFSVPEGVANAEVSVVPLTSGGDPDVYYSTSSSVSPGLSSQNGESSGGDTILVDTTPTGVGHAGFFCVKNGGGNGALAVGIQVLALPSANNAVALTCAHTGAQVPLFGDSDGSPWDGFVSCPGTCDNSSAVVGTSQYAIESSVCAAARHAGVVSPDVDGVQLARLRFSLMDAEVYRASAGYHDMESESRRFTGTEDVMEFFTGGSTETGLETLDPSVADENSRNQQGFGRVSVHNAAPLNATGTDLHVLANGSDTSSSLTTSTTSASWCFTVVAGGASDQIRATLAWTDPAASLSASVQLVSDVDLSVELPDGTTVRGNTNNDTVTDSVNNLERVQVDGPYSAGRYCVSVRGKSLPTGKQRIAAVLLVPRGSIDSQGVVPSVTLESTGSGASGDESGDSAGALVVIVVVLAIAIVFAICYFMFKKREKRKREANLARQDAAQSAVGMQPPAAAGGQSLAQPSSQAQPVYGQPQQQYAQPQQPYAQPQQQYAQPQQQYAQPGSYGQPAQPGSYGQQPGSYGQQQAYAPQPTYAQQPQGEGAPQPI